VIASAKPSSHSIASHRRHAHGNTYNNTYTRRDVTSTGQTQIDTYNSERDSKMGVSGGLTSSRQYSTENPRSGGTYGGGGYSHAHTHDNSEHLSLSLKSFTTLFAER